MNKKSIKIKKTKKMIPNAVTVLKTILKADKEKRAKDMSISDFFDLFTFEQLLKDFELSYDELEQGKTEGGSDGGIDGFFIFLDGSLLEEEIVDPEEIHPNPNIDLFFIQSKTTMSFEKTALVKISSTISDLFSNFGEFDKKKKELRTSYNSKILEKTDLFQKICKSLILKHPKLNIYFYYASQGDKNIINPDILYESKKLEEVTQKLLTTKNVQVKFFGARELLDLSGEPKTYQSELSYEGSPILGGENNFIFISDLTDYYKFITDGNDNLRSYLLESNVRDYLGKNEVNKDIITTLKDSKGGIDFLWLNNGVTVLASKCTITVFGKILLENAKIVNGLQTTMCIYDYLKQKYVKTSSSRGKKEHRKILIKVIVTKDSNIRDRIIKATNFQIRISSASLRATDAIQKDIETYFKENDLYYDRRKNYYKNLGQPVQKIISISYLAQAVITIIQKWPHIARGRPSSLLKKDEDYSKIFNSTQSIKIYLICSQIMKAVEKCLRKKEVSDFELAEKTNLRFHIAMLTVIYIVGKKEYKVDDIADFKINKIDCKIVKKAINLILPLAKEFAQKDGGTVDRVAKSEEFLSSLVDKITLK